MRRKEYILGILAFIMFGCYEDKGNYDYKEINDLVSVSFSPEPVINENTYEYVYKQPALDTLFVTYTPTVEQSKLSNENNLEYQWILTTEKDGKSVLDTIFEKELTLAYPPRTKTNYRPLFRLIDHSTGIELYRQFSMMTEVPYLTSWFVLHGEPGDRKLGVIEGINTPDDVPSVTYDAYESIWGVRRFQNAVGLCYATTDTKDYVNFEFERLVVIQADSLTQLYPFSLLAYKNYEQMMPSGIGRPRLAYAVDDEIEASTILVGENGKCFWSRGNGFYFTVKTEDATKNYVADKVYIASNHYVIIWNEQEHQFYYLVLPQIPYNIPTLHPGDAAYDTNNKLKLLREDEEHDIFEDGEWENQKLLYIGQGNSELSSEGAMFLGEKNGVYTVYRLGFNVKGTSSFIALEKEQLPANFHLDEDSQIMTSVAYADQFFFTRGGSAVYSYNMINGEENLLYDAGGEISKLKFRTSRTNANADYFGVMEPNNRLAIVVNNSDGTGEVHELYLNIAGDVSESHVYTGFGPIQDIVFANIGVAKNL